MAGINFNIGDKVQVVGKCKIYDKGIVEKMDIDKYCNVYVTINNNIYCVTLDDIFIERIK